MRNKAIFPLTFSVLIAFSLLIGLGLGPIGPANAGERTSRKPLSVNDRQISTHAQRMLDEGRQIFRFDTFGSEAFWGDALQLHKAIAGVNLHTWTGFGSVPYWNAYVAATEMHGSGAFVDQRFSNKDQYPVAAKDGAGNTRGTPDLVTSKLAALHFYEIAIPAPKPPAGSFDKGAAANGKDLFNKKAQCAACHVPPLFTEPGHNLHTPAEMGIDSFQADRSPTHMYRTAPLAGLWTHQKGGFYHDGRFPTLKDVLEHYDRNFKLGLTDREKGDLVEYLKSL